MIITGNRQYVCIPDENGVFNDEPYYMERGTMMDTNYDDIKALNPELPDILVYATIARITDELKKPQYTKTPELQARLNEIADSTLLVEGWNWVTNGVVAAFDFITNLW
jgi:hypothetical protein